MDLNKIDAILENHSRLHISIPVLLENHGRPLSTTNYGRPLSFTN